MKEPKDALTRMLRPAGGGIHVVSTGLDELRKLQAAIYGAQTDGIASDQLDTLIEQRWRQTLERLPNARVAVLGVPSDAGAGFTRGSNRAPGAIRQYLLGHTKHPIWFLALPRFILSL